MKIDKIKKSLCNGDLIFTQSEGDLNIAIQQVTSNNINYKFDHLGITNIDESKNIWIIEADSTGVKKSTLSEFANNSSVIIIGRLQKKYQYLISKVLWFVVNKTGEPYNNTYIIENKGYYCSELIYEAFKYANNNIPFFHLQPMTFIDPATNKTSEFWSDYYKKIGIEVPEGKPGINPTLILQSDKIKIISKINY